MIGLQTSKYMIRSRAGRASHMGEVDEGKQRENPSKIFLTTKDFNWSQPLDFKLESGHVGWRCRIFVGINWIELQLLHRFENFG